MLLYFNSIKVRLERTCPCTMLIRLKNFNSIKVRLEPISGVQSLNAFEFQFHKGTIRTAIDLVLLVFMMIFQFHKGTIRTKEVRRKTRRRRIFQFHKGTIRTLLPCRLMIIVVYFNSIKVRLEQQIPKATTLIVGFQFHKGTIRTR